MVGRAAAADDDADADGGDGGDEGASEDAAPSPSARSSSSDAAADAAVAAAVRLPGGCGRAARGYGRCGRKGHGVPAELRAELAAMFPALRPEEVAAAVSGCATAEEAIDACSLTRRRRR